MENKEIARLLWETADLMEIAAEDGFRIRSYRNGATAVEGYPERIVDILKDPERKVTDIPGIGKGLAGVLAEIAGRGSCERRDLLLEKFPPGALEFLKIQGLGPKSIALIFEHFRIGTIDELERLCQEQKLRGLPRMGAKLEEKVLRSIAGYRQRTGRYLLSYAEGVAAELGEILRKVPGVDAVTPAGSLRRGRETVGDLDLLVTGPSPAGALERFVALSAGGRSARPRRKQGQRQGGPRRIAGGRARPAAGELRRRHAVLHRQQGPQRRDSHARRQNGAQAERVRPVPRGRRHPRGRRDRRGHLPGAGPALDSAGTAREYRRNRSRRTGPASGTGGTAPHPRRPAHAHHRDRWPRHPGRNGRGGAPARLRIHRDHGPLQGARHGQRAGRKARGGVRPPRARDQSRPAWAFASSAASNATFSRMARWIWPTTRWPNSTW